MRNFVSISLSLFLLTSIGWAQDTRVIWQKTIGGAGDDAVNAIVSDLNENTYVLLSVQNGNNHDIEIAKINKAGDFLWVTSIAGDRDEIGKDLLINHDGNLVVLGATHSDELLGNVGKGYSDVLLAVLAPSGKIISTSTYGGSQNDVPASILQKSNGNYIITATSWSKDGDLTNNFGQSDIWLFETDAAGELQWEKSLGGLDDESAVKALLLENDALVLLGNSATYEGDYASNHGDQDIAIYSLDATGEILWQRLYGGFYSEIAADILQLANGNFFVAGTTFSDDGNISSNAGGSDAWFFEITELGMMEWSKTYGSYDNESVVSMVQTASGFLMLGSSRSSVINNISNHGETDFWLYEMDADKNRVSEQLFGASGYDRSSSVLLNDDGSILMGGSSSSSDGVVQGNSGKNDGWLLKIHQSDLKNSSDITVHPNPTKDVVYLNNLPDGAEISLLSINGATVTNPQTTSRSVEIMDLSALPSGVYLLKVEFSETVETHRIVKH